MSKDIIYREDAIKAIEELPNAYNGWSDAYDKAYIIGTLEEVPKADRRQGEWIPCSERMPKIGEYNISEPCIVYCKGGVYAFAELEENIFGQVGWNCERDDDYHEPIGEVVAWMPLPKPYEVKESE